MSDGPHRSLPMRRHWRDLAEVAAKTVFSADEVCEALPFALAKDLVECPLDVVRNILGPQSILFPEELIGHLEEVRKVCRGSAVSNIFIDCAIEAARNGLSGEAAFRLALENTCEERARSGFRTVEEHYQREANARSANHVRDRLDAARLRCDFKAIASAFVSSSKPYRNIRPPQHTGLEEGPAKS